jgi:hypothetical protein
MSRNSLLVIEPNIACNIELYLLLWRRSTACIDPA